MNILHLLVSLPRGGKERLVLDVCREGKGVGLNGSVLALESGSMFEEFVQAGIDIGVCKRRYPVDRSVVRAIRKVIEEKHIDLVHSHEPVEGIHAHLATRLTSTPHVMSLHGFFEGAKNRSALWFLRSRVDALICVSDAYRVQESLMHSRSSMAPLTVLHNGIDFKRFDTSRGSCRAELNLGDEVQLSGTIAHFVHGKDPLTIAKALGSVLPLLPSLHFVFVGSRDERFPSLYDESWRYCRNMPGGDRVHFLGSRRDIPAIMSSLDLLVQSSTVETFGLVPAEAMYMGTPVLLSRIPAFLELAGSERNAFFFGAGSAEDLARHMVALLNNTEERTRKAHAAREWVSQNYSIERHLVGLRDVYLGTLARRSRHQYSALT